jgi:hypothetical protein
MSIFYRYKAAKSNVLISIHNQIQWAFKKSRFECGEQKWLEQIQKTR